MKVFISYSRDTEASARALVSDLESLGHEVWYDRELSGGQAWWAQILAAIRDCGLFVFVLHPRSLDSVACTRERGYALALGKALLPVQVADGVSVNLLPPELAQRQIIPYRSGDRAEVLALARAVAAVPPAPPLPDPLPPPPEVPASYLGALAARIDGDMALRFEDQSALLVDLRQALRDPASQADAEVLLGRLRRRRDLLAAIAEEIDTLRERTQPPPRRASVEPPPVAPPPPAPSAAEGPVPARTDAVPGRWPRPWVFAAVGLGIGVLSAAAYVMGRSGWQGLEVGLLVLLPAAGGLIAGWLTGQDRLGPHFTALGAGGGLAAWLFVVSGAEALASGVAFALPGGAVVGALAGRLWRRLRPH